MPDNPFEDFFTEAVYCFFKNDLYNYMVRKRAIENELKNERPDRVLEVGCGISPTVTRAERVLYTDLSHKALQYLKKEQGQAWFVVADGTRLPFKDRCFSHVVCSEVLEHIENDQAVIHEMARVMHPSGQLLVTFPHKRLYFSIDDRLVHHHRRYEIWDMLRKMDNSGLIPLKVKKIMGPLEKVTMISAAVCYLTVRKLAFFFSGGGIRASRPATFLKIAGPLFKYANHVYAWIVRLDALITPRGLASVLLMKSMRDRSKVSE